VTRRRERALARESMDDDEDGPSEQRKGKRQECPRTKHIPTTPKKSLKNVVGCVVEVSWSIRQTGVVE
jgi:hypothetical protein